MLAIEVVGDDRAELPRLSPRLRVLVKRRNKVRTDSIRTGEGRLVPWKDQPFLLGIDQGSFGSSEVYNIYCSVACVLVAQGQASCCV